MIAQSPMRACRLYTSDPNATCDAELYETCPSCRPRDDWNEVLRLAGRAVLGGTVITTVLADQQQTRALDVL